MNKILLYLSILLLFTFGGIFVTRFILNGGEDTWICDNNKWIKYGNPKYPAPTTGCGDIVESTISEKTNSFPKVTPSNADSDEDIIAGVTQAFVEKYKRPVTSFMLIVEEKDATHAKGSVRFKDELDGGIWFAAKTSMGWELVFDGQGIMSCENANKYNFSTVMVPGCVDINNGNNFIQR